MTSPLGPFDIDNLITKGPATTVKAEEAKASSSIKDDEAATRVAEQLDGKTSSDDTEKKETIFNEDAFAEITDRPEFIKPKSPDDKQTKDKESTDEETTETAETEETSEETESEKEGETGDTKESTSGDDDIPPTARSVKQIAEELKLTEEETKLFSQMSNNSKDYFKSKLKELKAAQEKLEKLKVEKPADASDNGTPQQGKLPENWYEHEEAYQLDPTYIETSQSVNLARDIVNHFQQQLAKIEEGEEWEDLTMSNDGKILKVKKEATVTSKAEATQRISAAAAWMQNQQAKLYSVRDTFKDRVSNAFNRMRETENKYFPQYSEEQELEKIPEVKTFQERLKQNGLNKNILAGFTTKMYAYTMQLMKEAQEKDSEIERLKNLKEIQRKVEPSSKEVKGGGKLTKLPIEKRPFMADMFEKIKEGAL